MIIFLLFYNKNKLPKISTVSYNLKKLSFNDNMKKKSKIVAITYSNEFYKRQIKLNRKSSLEIGEVDVHYSYGPEDLDEKFKEKNKEILIGKKGNGYWLWKPYFINKTIVENLNYGDYLIYTDARMIFMNSSYLLINFLEKNNASMWMNRLTLKESQWTKRDAFILIGVDKPYYYDSNQYMAGIQIYKKTEYTVKFIQEWLYYCQDKRIITDSSNVLGKKNYKNFRENRHDQSALSLLIKKHGEANSGHSNMSENELKSIKPIIMPNIICMYRGMHFHNYKDLKKKCQNIIKIQNHLFS